MIDFATAPIYIGLVFAFVGGLVSFLSPCVLPLVPAYLGYLGGKAASVIKNKSDVTITAADRWLIMVNGFAFVLGFTFVFVVFGLLATALLFVIGGTNVSSVRDMITRLGGMLVVLFGLHFSGLLPSAFAWLRKQTTLIAQPLLSIGAALLVAVVLWWGVVGSLMPDMRLTPAWVLILALTLIAMVVALMFIGGAFTAPATFWVKLTNTIEYTLYSDTRLQIASNNGSLGGSALMGMVFAAGWTPCIGPIYGGILTMASTTNNLMMGGVLLLAYSLGLGVPFLVAAAMIDRARGGLKLIQPHMATIKLATGAFLVFIGVLVMTGRMTMLTQGLANEYGDFAYQLEESVDQGLGNFFGLGPAAPSTIAPSIVAPSATPAPMILPTIDVTNAVDLQSNGADSSAQESALEAVLQDATPSPTP
jgi:cytochrome c-type biogenesis protein